MIKKLRFLFAACLLIGLVSCERRSISPDVPREFGFRESVSGRDVVSGAIELANRLLSDRTPIRFIPSWNLAGQPERDVPVYLVESSALRPFGPASVPDNRRCVFIDAGQLADLWESITSQPKKPRVVASATLLAVILLHEAGHLSLGHPGNFVAARGGVARRNLDPTVSKTNEQAADNFAAKVIKEGMDAPQKEHQDAAFELVNILLVTEIALVKDRWRKNPSHSDAAEREEFQDLDDTHPNLEYRFRCITHALNPSQISDKLLRYYEKMRQDPATGASPPEAR